MSRRLALWRDSSLRRGVENAGDLIWSTFSGGGHDTKANDAQMWIFGKCVDIHRLINARYQSVMASSKSQNAPCGRMQNVCPPNFAQVRKSIIRQPTPNPNGLPTTNWVYEKEKKKKKCSPYSATHAHLLLDRSHLSFELLEPAVLHAEVNSGAGCSASLAFAAVTPGLHLSRIRRAPVSQDTPVHHLVAASFAVDNLALLSGIGPAVSTVAPPPPPPPP